MGAFTDEIIRKFGADKVLHFLGGALICAVVSIVMDVQEGVTGWRTLLVPLAGLIVALFAAWVKERFLDSSVDKKDLLATVLGFVPVWLAFAIGTLFNYLSILLSTRRTFWLPCWALSRYGWRLLSVHCLTIYRSEL